MPDKSPRISARAVIYNEDSILLVKYEDDRGFWYITPGGGVEHGETLIEALHREVLEEMGARVRAGDILCVREIMGSRHPDAHLPADFHQVELFVQCELLELGSGISAPDPQMIGFEWIKLEELGNILFFPTGMTEFFQNKKFPRIYYGEMR